MATAPPIKRGEGDPAVRIGPWLLPGSVTWLTIGMGLLSGIPGLPTWRASVADFIRTCVTALLAGAAMWLLTHIGFPVHEAEQTAHHALDVPISGWWAAAPWAVGLGWLIWVGMWKVLPGKGHPALASAMLCLVALMAGPLFAFPFALGALAVRIHPLFGIAPVVLWLQPSVLREITFHGLAAPWMWSLLFLATWPAFGRRKSNGMPS